MKLVKPNNKYETHYHEMMQDWYRTGEELVPFPLEYEYSDFEAFVDRLNKASLVPENEGWVCCSTFWLFNEDDVLVGVSNIRHELTDRLMQEGGHIGFGIRPGYRRRGYATKILELSLVETKKLGIDKVLVTCDKPNIASGKTILKNGGMLWKEHEFEGVVKQLYWITFQ